jgi:hypothetical protein
MDLIVASMALGLIPSCTTTNGTGEKIGSLPVEQVAGDDIRA